jgi:RNA polymerase sigma factor (sigma-70 family)
MPDDRQLLRDYARDRSENAFAELARRHVDLVYSAALRETHGDAPQAQDITQAVFAELARKAAELGRHPALAGWLYTCVRQMSANARRAEERRRRREQEAHAMNELLADSPDAAWQQVQPVLDDAMHELNDTERAAVVLRFFEDRSHEEVGEALGLSETAARKRVDRALEKLRALLARRGVTSTVSGLAAALAFGAVMAAPSGLAGTIATGALATSAVTSTTTSTTTVLKIMAMSKIKLGIISAIVLVSAATTTTLVVQHHSRPEPDYFPLDSWRMAGYATPENAMETFFWAWRTADAKTMEATMTTQATEEFQKELGAKTLEQSLKEDAVDIKKTVKGYRIMERRTNSEEEVVLKIVAETLDGNNTNEMVAKKIGASWRVDETPE